MAFNHILKKTLDATLTLVELTDIDDSNEKKSLSLLKKPQTKPSTAQKAGRDEPFIKINGYSVLNIESLVIDETDFLPKVSLVFVDAAGEFNGTAFPKNNMIMSVYVKTSNSKFLPLRQDFLITSIRSAAPSQGGTDMGSTGIEYVVKGELFVPRLYNNVSKSYPNLTSRDALFKVAEELKLGFAENAVAPIDTMTWINFNTSPANFIRDVASHAYQDIDSFFTAFISKEYCLCYVNVNEQMIPGESDQTFVNYTDSAAVDLNSQSKFDDESGTVLNFLSTLSSSKGKPNYIMEMTLLSDQGQILKSNGYKKKVYYYDQSLTSEPSEKFIDYFVAPTNTVGLPEDQILLPEPEGLSDVGLKKWMNIEYGNTHSKWNHARVTNDVNLKELEKIQMKITLDGINFQIIRGSVIPLVISQRVAQQVRKEFSKENYEEVLDQSESPENEVPDKQLSGKYWVKAAKYHFDGDTKKFQTELFLARREWVPSKKIETPNV